MTQNKIIHLSKSNYYTAADAILLPNNLTYYQSGFRLRYCTQITQMCYNKTLLKKSVANN